MLSDYSKTGKVKIDMQGYLSTILYNLPKEYDGIPPSRNVWPCAFEPLDVRASACQELRYRALQNIGALASTFRPRFVSVSFNSPWATMSLLPFVCPFPISMAIGCPFWMVYGESPNVAPLPSYRLTVTGTVSGVER